jgi:hypothetical protein
MTRADVKCEFEIDMTAAYPIRGREVQFPHLSSRVGGPERIGTFRGQSIRRNRAERQKAAEGRADAQKLESWKMIIEQLNR